MLNEKAAILPAFERNNVPVVLASSNMYAPYAGVLIQSLIDHASEKNNYDIIIFQRDISKENKRLLKSLAAGHANVSIRFYDPSSLFASFHYVDEEHNWPLEIFYRIVAPHILNYSGHIITVGIDTLLKTDIARLMDEDLEGCCIGGVSNAPDIYASCLVNRGGRLRERWRNRGGIHDWENWKSYKNHVNGCLILYDCDKYIQEVDLETVLNTAQQDGGTLIDESVLNYLMEGKIKLLDLAWNVQLPLSASAMKKFNLKSEIYSEIYNEDKIFERACENPYLLHWANKPKPWVCPDVVYGSDWWQTALRTPFVGHIIARMIDELGKRRAYYRERYGKDVDVWDPKPKGIDRT